MKDSYETQTQLTASQRRAIRSHAQKQTRKLNLDLDVHDAQWADLASQRAECRRAARDVADGLSDSVPPEMAEQIEAAHDALMTLADLIDAEMDARQARGSKAPTSAIDPRTAAPMAYRESMNGGGQEAYALRSGQPVRTWAQARGMGGDDLGVGQYLRALTAGARTDAEHRALAEGVDAAGGHTVPTVVSSELIDLARASMVLDRAGARTVPLDSDKTVIARVASDPTPAFRAENDPVAESDPTFSRVLLEPKSIAVMVKASVELMQDSLNLEAELPNILARALAVEIDKAGLVGSGSGNEPTGIVNYAGLTANGFGGGALSGYGPLMQARGALHGANERLGAFVLASRDENDLAALSASDGQPLMMPRAIEQIPMLHTTSLPTDGGAGSDESSIIAGDFSQLLVGVRSEIRVETLRERFMDSLQFGLIAHARVDFAAARESAFTVLDGVQG